MQDTIFAFATPEGRSALAVVRISGSRCGEIVSSLIGGSLQARRASLVKLRDPADGSALDQAIAISSPGPRSFTGEDCLELQVHGSLAVRKALLRVLGAVEGCRLAEAGEFTRRAFLNGKSDLSRLEGLADLLQAETEAQRKQAFRQIDGAAGQACASWRESLLSCLALLEASIDFADENDAPDDVLEEVGVRLSALREALRRELDVAAGRQVIRDGFRVVLAGPPNAGKSSLLNALARRDLAIVSEVAGTTRDIVEVSLDLGGMLVLLQDTAGIRETRDRVETIGIERAKRAGREADLVLWLRGCGIGPAPDHELTHNQNVIHVNTKSDLCDNRQPGAALWVSALTSEGIPELVEAIRQFCAAAVNGTESGFVVHARQRHHVSSCHDAVVRALSCINSGAAELISEELRTANDALARLVGKIGTEDVLGEIFSRFCIGK